MSFNSLLDRLCTIESNTKAQDTSGQKIPTWSTAASDVACRLDPIGGGLKRLPTAVYEKATHELFMHVQSGITITTKTYRIVISSNNYKILLVPDLHGFSGTHHLELILELEQ